MSCVPLLIFPWTMSAIVACLEQIIVFGVLRRLEFSRGVIFGAAGVQGRRARMVG